MNRDRWRVRLTSFVCASAVCILSRAETTAGEKLFTHHIHNSALTAKPGTLELGVFSASKYALSEHVEISLHPIALLAWPQINAKVRWFDFDTFTLATHHSLSYPTRFFDVVAREGTGGLVDPNVDLPATGLTELGVLATWRLSPRSWATLQPLLQARLGSALPILEFPFLYQRLAAANAGWSVGLNAALEGLIGNTVGYEFSATYLHLPLPPYENAFALEAFMEARVLLSEHSTLPFGVRFAHARFPYGRRNHWLPYVDFRFVW